MAGPGPPDQSSITVNPNPINYGTGVVGTPLNLNVTVNFFYSGIGPAPQVTNVTSSNPVFVPAGLPAFPRTTFFTFTLAATDTGAATYTGNLVLTTSIGTIVVPIKAIFAAGGSPGTGLLFVPSAINFPTDVLHVVDTVTIDIQNTTGADIHISGIDFSDPQISLDPSEVLPLTVLAMSTLAAVKFNGDHEFLGIYGGTATFHTDVGDFVVPTSISTIPFVESNPLTGNASDLVFAFQPGAGGATIGNHLPNAKDLNLDQDCSLIFNGALWDKPGYEKTLRRLEVFYENYGLCTGLRLIIQVWRPKATPPVIQTETYTISIGDAEADLSERSAYFDVNLAGEFILATLVRVANTGPVSILGFTPEFEDKGEKVENV